MHKLTSEQQFIRQLDNPVYFAQKVLGRRLWDKQAEILNSVRENSRTAVRSCHGIGKTFTAAICILWFLYSRPKAIVLSTAPTWRQVEKLIWKEVRSAYREALVPLGGELMPRSPELHIIPDEWYAAGLSTNEPERFQGFHEQHILLVIDEASGVKPEIYEAAEGILTSNGARLLLLGNPTIPHGPFYEAFRGRSYKTFHVSAFDTPNFAGITPVDLETGEWESKAKIVIPSLIVPSWAAERLREWGKDSVPYQVRVLGNFPEYSEDNLIPLSWVEAAMGRESVNDGECVIGADIAAYGNDRTVIAIRCGNAIVDLRVYMGKNTRETAGLIMQAAREYKVEVIHVDEIGIGRGVVDSLEESGYVNCGVNVSERARDNERFTNLRAELYWGLRERLSPESVDGVSLPVRDDLLGELCGLKWKVNAVGKIQMESKDEIRRRSGKSPDLADAIMLAFADGLTHKFSVFTGGKSVYSRL